MNKKKKNKSDKPYLYLSPIQEVKSVAMKVLSSMLPNAIIEDVEVNDGPVHFVAKYPRRRLSNIANAFLNTANSFPDIANKFANIANKFPNIANKFSNIANVFSDIADEFPNIANDFSNIANAFPDGIMMHAVNYDASSMQVTISMSIMVSDLTDIEYRRLIT